VKDYKTAFRNIPTKSYFIHLKWFSVSYKSAEFMQMVKNIFYNAKERKLFFRLF